MLKLLATAIDYTFIHYDLYSLFLVLHRVLRESDKCDENKTVFCRIGRIVLRRNSMVTIETCTHALIALTAFT